MNYKIKLISLLKRLGFVLLLFIVMRNLMYIFNTELFNNLGFIELLKINFFGLRFDIASVIATNSIFIVLYLLPINISYTKLYTKLLNSLYLGVNIINIIANMSDIIYYRFTLKRTTFEFIQMFNEDSGMFNIASGFILDFWYITLISIVLIALLVIFTIKNTSNILRKYTKEQFYKFSIIRILLNISIIALGVVLSRGGLQLRPISIIDASNYAKAKNQALVLNTSFSIMRTIGKQTVSQKTYFSKENLSKHINTEHIPKYSTKFRPLNVVVIIMESMSKEHSAFYNTNLEAPGFTPFLDSLSKHSLICTQTYANGRKSIEGIPAILASFPTLFNDAFISSNYSSNRINSLASLLSTEGYSTSFFHGGNNGTMGFNNFMASIGFDNYYGRKEYNNEDDFDGKWGITDHKFFEFFNDELSKKSEPFFSSIFSLSAHHPYTIPEEFNGKFPEGKGEIQQSMAYSDYSLMKFFESAKKQKWFKNTLFVITADHTSEITDPDYSSNGGKYAVPMIFYMPKDSLSGEFNSTCQQIDIMPSVLDYINFPKEYYSLGNSIFSDSKYRESISYTSGIYQYISGNEVYQFNSMNDSVISKSILSKNLNAKADSIPNKKLRIMSLIQTFNGDLIGDRMHR